MSSLIKDMLIDLPAYECVEYAQGCEAFMFKAKSEKECWNLFNRFLYTVPDTKVVKGYNMGLRPDYPVPVARYFIEVSVDEVEPNDFALISFWTRREIGRLKKGA